MNTVDKKNSVSTTLKLWVFPALVTIIATLIWRDVTEMRSDIKMLLAQSNIDKTKIEQLEKDVKMLNQAVFNMKAPVAAIEDRPALSYDKLFKHEDFYSINKIKSEL
jgi:hypothetical protein